MSAFAADFSYGYYRFMLEAVKRDGRPFLSFTEFDPASHPRAFLLRHDIDICLESAVRMARIEHELGVRAIYFLRLNSTFYNPFSQHEFPLVQELVRLKHDIGLHFDPSFYLASGWDVAKGIAIEKAALSAMLNVPVHAISQHRPVSLGMQYEALGEHVWHYAYHPRYTKDCKYISESAQRWREGDVIRHLARHPRLQCLVHPIWWNETHTPWQQCLKNAADRGVSRIHGKCELLLTRYQDYLNKS